jgi:hypothetical protein
MANQEHVAKLLEGPEVWNRWREAFQTFARRISVRQIFARPSLEEDMGTPLRPPL